MWVPAKIYKKSTRAILAMLSGVILSLCGVALVTEGNKAIGIILILFGIVLFVFSGILATLKQNKRREKYLDRAEFVKKIQRSSLQAFYLYEKIPEQKTLRYISRHNPYAAEKITQLNNHEITVDKAIADLEAHDAKRRR